MMMFIIIGIGMIGYGLFLKQKESQQSKKLEGYRQQIQDQNESFLAQFRLGQEQLEGLYGKHLNQISKDVATIKQQLSQIQGGVLPFELQTKEQQINTLLKQGKSPSDIANFLKISVSEVLLSVEK